MADRRKRGSKGVAADEAQANARIIPALGAIEAEKLTKRRLDAWLLDLAISPRRLRTGKFATSQATRDFDHNDGDEVRRRRSTANRVLTILNAALNHAFNEGHIDSDDAWRKVKPFRSRRRCGSLSFGRRMRASSIRAGGVPQPGQGSADGLPLR
jgi:hypothetical protein